MSETATTKQILDFWRLQEQLQVNEFPKVKILDNEEKEKITKYEKSYRFSSYICKEDNFDLFSSTEGDKLSVEGSSIDLCCGRIDEEDLIESLYFSLSIKDDRPNAEITKICLFGLQITNDNEYIENTFNISPFVCGLYSVIQKQKNIPDSLDSIKRDCLMLLQNDEIDFHNKLVEIYEKIVTELLWYVDNASKKAMLTIAEFYSRYSTIEEKEQDEESLQHESMLGGSFIIEDLDLVSTTDQKSTILNKYIPILNESGLQKIDIRKDENEQEVRDILSIEKMPLGKWPSKYKPSLMQQMAINYALSDKQPLFSVNGPPGTGKTALLKEIIADIEVKRALLLCNFENPNDAFSIQTIPGKESAKYGYLKRWAKPDSRITDYGILVTSCNNNAVENISKELPDYAKLYDEINERPYAALFSKDDNTDTYFSLESKKLLGENTWGLVSAPLGKQSNIGQFCSFVLKFGKKNCNYKGIVFYKDVEIEKNNNCQVFQEAKKAFKDKYEEVLLLRKKLGLFEHFCKDNEEIRNIANNQIKLDTEKIQTIEKNSRELNENIETMNLLINKSICLLSELNSKIRMQQDEVTELRTKVFDIENRLNFWEKLFLKILHTEKIEYYKELCKELHSKIQTVEKSKNEYNSEEIEKNSLSAKFVQLQNKLQKNEIDKDALIKKMNVCNEQILSYEKRIKDEKEKFGIVDSIPVDLDFIIKYHQNDCTVQECDPWVTTEYDILREELFYYALKLHHAFVVCSKSMRDNMKLLCQIWTGGEEITYTDDEKDLFFTDLFQSLFLMVPVLSTTFASVQRMLRNIKTASKIGYLIIDEAGQAAPQMAVGALYRAKRAIVVGDPLQVEPVITFPEALDKFVYNDKIGKYQNRKKSVQTFADRMNKYGSLLPDNSDVSGEANVWVGCPLVVHRRCISPMFDISNMLAYGNTMLKLTAEPKTNKYVFDESCWIQIAGKEVGNKNHYVDVQGNAIIKSLIAKQDIINQEKIYVISPFTSVVYRMKNLLKDSGFEDIACGTVHTFQGKEADEVFFVLGCDSHAKGAIQWVNLNIVNVAVTRAKYRLYVVGDRTIWEMNKNVNVIISQITKCRSGQSYESL
jgi:hypothetical protein